MRKMKIQHEKYRDTATSAMTTIIRLLSTTTPLYNTSTTPIATITTSPTTLGKTKSTPTTLDTTSKPIVTTSNIRMQNEKYEDAAWEIWGCSIRNMRMQH